MPPKGWRKNQAQTLAVPVEVAPMVEGADAPYAGKRIAPLSEVEVLPPEQPSTAVAVAPKTVYALPASITIHLTDEDLEPARRAKEAHARAAAKHIRAEIQSEMRRKEMGEIEELSVPQVVAFDLSAAFTKIAQQKARAAGYRFVQHLRKTSEGWVFEASNVQKVKDVPPSDQP